MTRDLYLFKFLIYGKAFYNVEILSINDMTVLYQKIRVYKKLFGGMRHILKNKKKLGGN